MNDITAALHYLLMPLAAAEYSYVHFPSPLARWPLAVWQGPWQDPRIVSYSLSSVDGKEPFFTHLPFPLNGFWVYACMTFTNCEFKGWFPNKNI